MEAEKILYGQTILEEGDLAESSIDYLVELTYYKTNKRQADSTIYGIEVVKTEHAKDKVTEEANEIDFFTRNERIVDTVLKLLKQYKVTPMGLRDSVFEIVKSGAL